MIKLYTKPQCPKCDITKEKLEAAKIEYIQITATEDHIAIGVNALPALETNDELVTDFTSIIGIINTISNTKGTLETIETADDEIDEATNDVAETIDEPVMTDDLRLCTNLTNYIGKLKPDVKEFLTGLIDAGETCQFNEPKEPELCARTTFAPKFTIDLELDDDFVKTLNDILCKYTQNGDRINEDLARINNMHNSNLNFSSFIDEFTKSEHLNDISPEANANQDSMDICSLEANLVKPHHKILSFNKIFYETKKLFGITEATEWLEGELIGHYYLHDASSATYKPYCFAYDIDQIVERGLFFINRFKTGPAKHLTTFNDHILESISWLCNRSSGAVGLSSYFVYSWWFWYNDTKSEYYLKNPEYYRRQCFQKFIYDLNQPYLRVTESAFTNVSIMDHCYLTELFGGRKFPDGTYAIDHIDDIIEHQKVFMEVLAEVRDNIMVTFPVVTYSLLFQDGKFQDEPFAQWCSDHNVKWGDANFFVGDSVTSLSNCCFDGSQEVSIKVKNNVYHGELRRLYQTYAHREDLTAFVNGQWRECKLTALEESRAMYEITTEHGRTIKCTHDHVHPIYGETNTEKKTYDLNVDDAFIIDTTCPGHEDGEKFDKIVSIERYDTDDKWIFCLEMKDQSDPYFVLKNGIRTHNCRLISQSEKLDAFINSIGGTALSIGSIKVNTINLASIAIEALETAETEADSEREFINLLNIRVACCLRTLHIVRGIIARNIEKGLLPNYSHGLISLDKQYNTIGITAMYEVLSLFDYINTDEFGNREYSDNAINFACKIMDTINMLKDEFTAAEDIDYSVNIECIPAERANVVLAQKDKMLHGDKAPATLIYSNQWIPLAEKCTLNEKVRLGSILDKQCGGGQISHINLDAPFTTKGQAWEMLNSIANAGVIYFAFNMVMSTCDNNHVFYGEKCAKCGGPATEKYTRVVGFFTPVGKWSAERRQEFDQRTWFKIAKDRGVSECE